MHNLVLTSLRRHPAFHTLTFAVFTAASIGASAAEVPDAASTTIDITDQTVPQINCRARVSFPAPVVGRFSVRPNCPDEANSPSISTPIAIGRPTSGCEKDAVVAPEPPGSYRPCGTTHLPTGRIKPPEEPPNNINISNCSRINAVVVPPKPCTHRLINRASIVVGQ